MIRAKGQDVERPGGLTRVTGTGVLVSANGKIMTAAHVVQRHGRDRGRIPGDETLPARVLSSEPAG